MLAQELKRVFFNRFLSENFVDIFDVRDNVGRTSLHYAALRNDAGRFFNLMVECGADANAKDNVRGFESLPKVSIIENIQMHLVPKLLS